MFLKKFLWCLSFSVFLAGLGYHFAGPLGLFRPRVQAGPVLAGHVLGRTHSPDERLVSRTVGRNSSFWYLTPADRVVSSAVLSGRPLVSWTAPDRSLKPLREGSAVVPAPGPGLETGRDESEAAVTSAASVRAPGRR